MRLDRLHREFLTYLEMERNYSPHTVTSYRSDFHTFLSFLSGEGDLPPFFGPVTVRGLQPPLRCGGGGRA